MTLASRRVAAVAVAACVLGAGAAAPAWARAPLQEPEAPPADAASAPVQADDALQAGVDVPAPKRKRLVLPEYPEDAKALGVRGIVLLEVIIERDGRVGDVRVTRSIPELDAAAVEAVRQWEYEVSRVEGRPVRVRLTVPITFSMRLPEIERESGVPELRQGVLPLFPDGGGAGETVEANVTLDPNGRVVEALVTRGESPWAEALLRALRTWVFNWNEPAAILTFHLRAEFVRGRKDDDSVVTLHASKPQRLEVLAPGPPPGEPAPPGAAPAGQPATAPGDTTAAAPGNAGRPAAPAPAAPPEPTEKAAPAPAPAPAAEPAGPVAAEAPPPPAPEPAPAPPAAEPSDSAAEAAQPQPREAGATEEAATSAAPAAPPVETIHVPPRPEPAPSGPGAPAAAPPPSTPGFSSVQGVSLGVGVPDLLQGRRPVVPPFARMAGTTGQVEVSFSVGVAGSTTIQSVVGPDLLKPAAEQMVATWLFRRTTTQRLYLVAVVEYGAESATAAVTLVP